MSWYDEFYTTLISVEPAEVRPAEWGLVISFLSLYMFAEIN